MKKSSLAALIIILAAVLVGGFIYYQKNKLDLPPIHNMSGRVTAVGNESITVTGNLSNRASVYTQEGPALEEVIEFTITPNTTFQKKVVFIAKKYQVQTGTSTSFTPTTFTSKGSFEDMMVGLPVVMQSKDNLFEEKRAEAFEIKYQLTEYEK